MMGSQTRAERSYARTTEIRRAVQTVRATGIDVASVDLLPDGTIRLSRAETEGRRSATEFDRWDAAGRL